VRLAEGGGRFRRCSDEIAAALDGACMAGCDRARVGPRVDAVLRWHYVSGELLVDFSLVDMNTGAVSTVRPVGAFPLRVPPPIHDCGYGLDDVDADDDFLPTLAAASARRDSARRQAAAAAANASLLMLPDNLLVAVFRLLLRRCTCVCHSGQIAAEAAVHALCTLELVCKRFREPRPELSLPEQAARDLCNELCVGSAEPLVLTRRCWKEQLLWLDPKTTERETHLKQQLYATAYRKRADGKWANDDVVRAAAIAEIKRRWNVWDIALAHASESAK